MIHEKRGHEIIFTTSAINKEYIWITYQVINELISIKSIVSQSINLVNQLFVD